MATRVATVFGASGFLGRYVVGRLARENWVVRAAVRHPKRASFLKPLGDVGQVTPIHAPIQDGDLVAGAVEGADAVVNLVGILFERGRQTFKDVHAEGAATVARAAQTAGVRDLVQVSAIGADIRAAADYARSKGAAEMAVRSSFPDSVVLRPSIVFGPEDDFFNRFAAMARLSPALPLIGGGETRFQPVFVGNVADAVVAALSDPGCRGKVYELGGPEVYSFEALMQLLLKQIRRRRLLLPLPFALASLQAAFLELLPVPPLTRDQVRLLRSDNVVSEGALTLADLGVEATHPDLILPAYLQRYCPGGRFTSQVI